MKRTYPHWTPTPGHWGWLHTQGDARWEVEWRREEPGCPAGYYLFGPGVFGYYLGTGHKAETLNMADRIVTHGLAN